MSRPGAPSRAGLQVNAGSKCKGAPDADPVRGESADSGRKNGPRRNTAPQSAGHMLFSKREHKGGRSPKGGWAGAGLGYGIWSIRQLFPGMRPKDTPRLQLSRSPASGTAGGHAAGHLGAGEGRGGSVHARVGRGGGRQRRGVARRRLRRSWVFGGVGGTAGVVRAQEGRGQGNAAVASRRPGARLPRRCRPRDRGARYRHAGRPAMREALFMKSHRRLARQTTAGHSDGVRAPHRHQRASFSSHPARVLR